MRKIVFVLLALSPFFAGGGCDWELAAQMLGVVADSGVGHYDSPVVVDTTPVVVYDTPVVYDTSPVVYYDTPPVVYAPPVVGYDYGVVYQEWKRPPKARR